MFKKEKAVLFVVILIGILSLIGWVSDELLLSRISDSFAPMAPLTSILFIVSGVSYLIHLNKDLKSNFSLIPQILSYVSILILTVVLADFIFELNWEIESIFVQKPTKFGDDYIGRISETTGILFYLINVSLLISNKLNRKSYKNIFGLFSLIVFAVSFIFLIGFVENLPSFYHKNILRISLNTTICFFLLSLVQLSIINFKIWPFHYLKGDSIKRRLLRILLPIYFVAFIIFKIFKNFLIPNSDRLLAAGLFVFSIPIIILIINLVSNYVDKQISYTNRRLRESKEMFQGIIHNLLEGFYSSTINGDLLNYNTKFCEIVGLDSEKKHEGISTADFWVNAEEREVYLNNLFEKGFVESYIVKFKKIDGTHIMIELNSRLIKDEEGKPFRIEGVFQDITEKIGTKEALAESEKRYKDVIDISPSAILIHIKGEIVFQNPALGKLFGNSESVSLIGKSIVDYIHPGDVQIVINRVKKLHETNEQTPLMVERLLKTDGTLFYAEVTSFLMDYNNQKAVLTIVNDITERRKMELVTAFYQNISTALLNSESLHDVLITIRAELSKIMKTDNFYIAFYNEETGMLRADLEVDEMDEIDEWKAEGSITGYLMKQQVSKLFSKNDFLKLNKELNYELVGTLPECWLGVPLIEDGKAVGALVVQSYNNPKEYTLYHQSILELIANQLSVFIRNKEAERQVLESEKSFRGLFHTIGDAIYVQDFDARFIDVNEGVLKMYGYERNEIIGNTPEFLSAPDKNDMVSVFDAFDKVKLGIPQVFEFWGLRKDGSVFPKMVRQFNGTYFGKEVIITLASDITNRKKMEFELLEAKEKAEESERLKSAFLANMSHEIRTPMNSILGFSDLLMSEDISDEKRVKYHEIVNSSGKRLMNLITDIIDVSKIDAQQLSMSYGVFNLNKLIDTLYHQFNISPKKKNIVLSRHKSLPDDQSFVNCDETRLAQVLSNLLENALKFTRDGIIDFGYELKDNQLHFYVKDSGIGINKKDHNLIFDRFGQSDNDKLAVKAGSGLGLSISKGIIEIFGGTIWVESELNKGSIFHFMIPNCLVAASSIISDSNEHKNELEQNPTITLLIAEDELSNFYYLEAVLEEFQFNLIHVENGKDAAEVALSNSNIDLILMDFNMPIMNGIDATIEIRKKKNTIPIIALTAYAMTEDKEKALSAGCNDYLSKPITKDLLLKTIHKYIKKAV